jgi:hypothetical protein
MPTKIINTDIVLRSLSNVPQSAKTSLRKQGHPLNHTTKFKFKKQNNIITARFLSGGITEATFLKEIDSYQYYLENTLNTTVEKENYDEAKTLKVKRKPGSGYVLINFYYILTKIPGQEINEGQQYELNIIEKLKNAGYTQQTKPENGIDVTINVNGKIANIELKEKVEAAFGSGTLEFKNNSWHISQKSSPVIKKLFNDELVDWVNDTWYNKTNEYKPNYPATKIDQQIMDRGTTHTKEISTDYVIEYYEKSDYIQIKEKGFFKLGDKNPLNLPSTKVSKFNPTSAYARIRVKNQGGNKFAYKIELYIGDTDPSINRKGLDGDLSFLQTSP